MSNEKKIAIAMSGGVDSSVAAYILKSEGHDVIGVNLHLWSCFKGSQKKSCCSPEDRRDARLICETIGIPFVSVDMREVFKEKVIEPFVREYAEGRTPNPCTRCNTQIKFEELLKWLDREMGIQELATGHYAQIERDDRGTHLLKGLDETKDQSYFLFDIPKEILGRLHFPLGKMTKDEARKIAVEQKLPVAEKAESQEICFIPDDDVAGFIEDFYPDVVRGRGNFVDGAGNILGQHRGTHAYTVGQRRGLGIGFGERRYVKKISPETNEVILGDDDELFTDSCSISHLRLLEDRPTTFDAMVKIRYRTPPTEASVSVDGNSAEIRFNEPVRAITPGQAAVIYDGNMVVGGGWID